MGDATAAGPTRRMWSPPAAVAAAMVAYAAVATLYEPFSWPMRVAVALPAAAVVALAVRRGWLGGVLRVGWARSAVPRSPGMAVWVGLGVWVLLLAALTVFQLAVFTSNPREVYPTLSSLANATFDDWWVRIAAFATWLWVGWYVVER
jgi:multidrug transporter EmrE-like cation transporter